MMHVADDTDDYDEERLGIKQDDESDEIEDFVEKMSSQDQVQKLREIVRAKKDTPNPSESQGDKKETTERAKSAKRRPDDRRRATRELDSKFL